MQCLSLYYLLSIFQAHSADNGMMHLLERVMCDCLPTDLAH